MPPLRRALQIARVVLTFRLDQPFLDALEQLQADHHRAADPAYRVDKAVRLERNQLCPAATHCPF